MKNYEGKIHLGKYEGLSANVTNKIDGKERKEYADRYVLFMSLVKFFFSCGIIKKS